MPRYPRRRDAAERGIIAALREAGASVEQLDGKGLPDLLVGFEGRTFLMEVKDPVMGATNNREARTGRKPTNDLGLRDTQASWWTWWRGAPPVIVTTPLEALAVIHNWGAAEALARGAERSGTGGDEDAPP